MFAGENATAGSARHQRLGFHHSPAVGPRTAGSLVSHICRNAARGYSGGHICKETLSNRKSYGITGNFYHCSS